MIVLGVTGNIGSGKTTVSHIFEELGAKVIDVDDISHICLDRNKELVKKEFQEFGLKNDYNFDRQNLARLVFENKDALKILCDILHPCIIKNVKEKLIQLDKINPNAVVIIDCALLFEIDFSIDIDYVLVVDASFNSRIKRLVTNGRFSEEDVKKREENQDLQIEKIRKADFVINNEKDISDTVSQVNRIWGKIAGNK